MATKKFIPEAWKQQWSKFMVTFFDYLPTKYEANKREWAVRKMIWDFKDGKRSVKVAELVAKRMREHFGAEVENVTLVCIPASAGTPCINPASRLMKKLGVLSSERSHATYLNLCAIPFGKRTQEKKRIKLFTLSKRISRWPRYPVPGSRSSCHTTGCRRRR